MNKDIRVLITCPDHPKVKKLMRKLGDKSFWCLIKFWCFVAVNKPEGNISSYDSDDIEIGAGWEGGEGLFYSAMVELGLIEETKEGSFVHDWEAHNGWAAGAEARSSKAKSAAKPRWEKRTNATSNTPSIKEQCSEHRISNAPSPSPSPSPNPKDKGKPPVEKFHPESMRPDWITEKDWVDIVSHRRKHPKKPVESERAYEGIINQLSLATKAGFSVAECVDCMTTSSWAGFKADWMKKDKNNGYAQGGFNNTGKRVL